MTHTPKLSTKSEASRQRLVTAAGRAFRNSGFGGIGVDGLAQGAGLTSGAFYFHFKSKLELFIESIRTGLTELRHGVEHFQTDNGDTWLARFVSFYMGYKRTCSMEDGCTLPLLTSEVERAGDQARSAYQTELTQLAAAVEKGLSGNGTMTSRQQAWAVLALLSGGVSMARAVQDEQLSQEIAAAIENAMTCIRLNTPI
jgi:TetR/AcrR family transcriptional regulator, transcriptional repressor for nem operon